MEWTNYVIAILAGVATAIPLIINLVKYIRAAVEEKNWNKLLDLVMDLMSEAETKFEDGATRKEWVMGMVQASANSIHYEIDVESLSNLIDALCAMSKQVNVGKKEA